MRSPASFLLAFLGAVGVVACVVHLEGAPCATDQNCPTAQYCGRDGKCLTRPVPVDLACERILRAAAERATVCRGGAPEAYEALLGAQALCASIASSADAGLQTYEPAALDACVAAMADAPCDKLSSTDLRPLLAGCQTLQPKQPKAGTCRNAFDCAEGLYCDTSTVCPGICAPLIQDGAPCDPAGAGCAPGTVCFAGTCRAFLGVDAGCTNYFTPPCAYGLGCISGVCAPQVGADAGCTFLGTECAVRFNCVPNGNARTCQPVKDVGATCTPGQGECGPLLWCGGSPATCRPWARFHESCGFINGELVGCLDGRCVNGVCEAFFATDEQCKSDSDCGPSGHCAKVGSNSSVCKPSYCQ